MSQLQAFLLELGKGFAFVSRQQRISTESKDFYVDLGGRARRKACVPSRIHVRSRSLDQRFQVTDNPLNAAKG